MTTLIGIAAAVVLVVVILAVGFVVGMRRRSPLVHRPMFWIQRRWLNPKQMRTAGQRGAYAGIIRHRGRRTGRAYETPVGVVVSGDDFLILLPYGRRSSWLRNVLASGSAEIEHEGGRYDVKDPAIVPMARFHDHFTQSDRILGRLFGTHECLRLTRS